jgi:hypothetical protein
VRKKESLKSFSMLVHLKRDLCLDRKLLHFERERQRERAEEKKLNKEALGRSKVLCDWMSLLLDLIVENCRLSGFMVLLN